MVMIETVVEHVRLLRLAARAMAGRFWWVVPTIPLVWPAFLIFRILVGWRTEAYAPYEAQGVLMAVPMTVLAVFLGVRIIAGEIDARTLEIAYTVPGGAHRLWLAKFAAGVVMLAVSEILMALVTFVFFTEFPPGALYGALQAPVFYMALAMAFSTLSRSEYTGALLTIVVLFLNALFTGFGGNQIRPSPFWNPAQPGLRDLDSRDVLSWTVQNRIGFVLVTAAVLALALARAERREKMLG